MDDLITIPRNSRVRVLLSWLPLAPGYSAAYGWTRTDAVPSRHGHAYRVELDEHTAEGEDTITVNRVDLDVVRYPTVEPDIVPADIRLADRLIAGFTPVSTVPEVEPSCPGWAEINGVRVPLNEVETDKACDCGDFLPGVLAGMNDGFGVQACGDCRRYEDDETAARALAEAVSGQVLRPPAGSRDPRIMVAGVSVHWPTVGLALRERLMKWLNPRQGEEAEQALRADAMVAAGFIQAQACTCEEGAAEGEVDACIRCQALGRAANQEIER